jgi:hypothetical protein
MLFGADIASSVPNKRSTQMTDEPVSTIEVARNKILSGMADLNFQDALSDVEEQLKKEKVKANRLALLSAKSWLLRNKLYSALHDPYIYSINEVENTDIFDDIEEEEDDSALDGLFGDDNDVDVDDGATDETVDVVITKNTTLNGHKVKKDAVVSVTPENAEKLISDGKAKLKE